MPEFKHRTMGNYLTAADIENGHIVRITGAGKYEKTRFRDNRLTLPATPHEPKSWVTGGNAEKLWGTNKTSEVNLFQAYKVDKTEVLANTFAIIEKGRQLIEGTWRNVLYGKACNEKGELKTPSLEAEPAEGETPPPTTPKTAPATAPTTEKTEPEAHPPIVSDETARYLKYNEAMIGRTIDPASWNGMPDNIKKELAALNWIVYEAGYPTLSPNAKQVLQ